MDLSQIQQSADVPQIDCTDCEFSTVPKRESQKSIYKQAKRNSILSIDNIIIPEVVFSEGTGIANGTVSLLSGNFSIRRKLVTT